MPAESQRNLNPRDLESLRIVRRSEPRKPLKFVPILVALIVACAAALVSYKVYSLTLGRPPEVQTVYVLAHQPGQSNVILTGSGYVVTRHKYITIGTKVLGQIVEEPIEEGQHVNRGDLLARIDDRDYRAQLDQAIANRDMSLANLKLKQAQAARERALYQSAVASRDQFDIAENALAVARADLERAAAAVEYAKFNVSQCYITSPISGTVLQKYRELGDTINYGGNIQAGGGATDIVQLADTEDMRAEVDINESDIAKLAMGTPAQVIPDAYPNDIFAAKVVKIYPEADRQKGTIKIEVQIQRPDLRIIKPEMSTKVNFVTSTAAGGATTLLVPKKALVSDGNVTSVWLVRNGLAYRVPVRTGHEFEDGVEIKEGVHEGDLVVVEPPGQLKEGQPVRSSPA